MVSVLDAIPCHNPINAATNRMKFSYDSNYP